jgi:glycosyltransferase involved in cell wall biosynthesis
MSLWVDVSSLVRWQGKPTGISRVASSLIHEWVKAGCPDLRFCRFEPSSGHFVEVPGSEMRRCLVEKLAPAAVIGPPPVVPPSRLARLKAKLKEALRPAFLVLPRWFREPIKNAAYAAVRHARGGLYRGRRAWRELQYTASGWLPGSRGPAVAFGGSDVLFSPGFSWDFPGYARAVYRLKRRQGFRFVPLIYDMIPHRFPHFFGPGTGEGYQAWAADVLWSADLVVTISENSRKDVLDFAREAQTPAPPVAVIRLGDDLPVDPAGGLPDGVAGLTADDPFVLTVGTVEVRKNHLLVYQIWRRLLQLYGPQVPKLVIVGRPGWLTGDLLYQIHGDPLTRDRLLVLTEAGDAELEWLYRHCLFTVYPSHYEGWGLPIAESLCHGKYCVASRASSMPEVGGDLVGYHDPLDVPGFLRLVSEAILDADFRRRREEEIRRRYRRTSWGETAAAVLVHLRPPAA